MGLVHRVAAEFKHDLYFDAGQSSVLGAFIAY